MHASRCASALFTILASSSLFAQALASVTSVGTGCGQRPDSFYEVFVPGPFDLLGQRLSAVNGSGCYSTTVAPALMDPPGSLSGNTIPLPLLNDDLMPVGTLGLVVCSNGHVCFDAGGPPNSIQGPPSVATMLANPWTGIYAWADFIPMTGIVYYEEAGSEAMITFQDVATVGGTSANTFQFRINTATGDFSITWESASTTNGTDWLVGYSNGGASLNPGASDISTFGGTPHTFGLCGPPLTLTAIGTPIQGTTNSTFQVTTSGFPALGGHVLLLNLGAPTPPFTLPAPFAAGCNVYMQLGWIVADLLCMAGGPSPLTCTGLVIPGAPMYTGVQFHLQAVFLPLPPPGMGPLLTSNALHCTIGV